MAIPCTRYGSQLVGAILLEARTAKNWVLHDLHPYGINPGTANHYENGLLNKYMNERVVCRLLKALEPINPATGKVWTMEEIKTLAKTPKPQ